MAYDEELADRIREAVQDEPLLSERKMFGGLAFLIGGHMAVAASGKGGLMVRADPAASDRLMVRVDPAEGAALVDDVHVRPMEMGERSMSGWLRVDDAAVTSEEELRQWVACGVGYASSLPPKEAGLSRPRSQRSVRPH